MTARPDHAVLFVEIPVGIKEELRRLAAENDGTMTAETRRALIAYINRHTNAETPAWRPLDWKARGND